MSWPRPRPLAWAGLLLLAVAAWRAWPSPRVGAPELPALRVVVFDASAGTTRRRPGWELWARRALRDEARAALADGEQLEVLVYGADVRRLQGGPDPSDWLEQLAGRGGQTLSLALEGRAALASELDAALAAVEPELLAPGRRARRLTLLAEPDRSGPDPTPRLARLVRGGVRVEWRRPPAAREPDLAVRELRLSASPAVGEPLVARVDLALAAGLATDLELELLVRHEWRGGERSLELPLPLPEGVPGADGYLRFSRSVDLGPTPEGSSRVLVRARCKPRGDAIPENDVASGSLRAGRTRLVALLAAPDRAEAARAWIGVDPERWPGLQWFVLTPAQLLSRSGEFDVVVSYDLACEELPRGELLRHLASGGGWLYCGGWRSARDLRDTNAARDARGLAAALPLVPRDDDAPPRDIVLLVDGSGSMVGEPFERVRAALEELVRVAPAGDELRLRFFTGTLSQPIVLDTAPEHLDETLDRLARLNVPGGPTAILYSLEQLVRQRAARERPALVLMLTDGRDVNAFDTRRRGAEIRADLASRGSELRALAAGSEADIEFLELLLGGAEGIVPARDLAGLGEVFQREVFAEAIREGTLGVSLSPVASGSLGDELARGWRQAGVSPPAVARYLRTRVRPGATTLWSSVEHDEPLLALQRVSGGLVAAWTSAPLAAWAPAYARADDLLGPLLRFLAAGRRRTAAPRLVAGARELLLEDVPPDWPLRVEARFSALLSGGDEALAVPLEELRLVFDVGDPLPGLDPRRRRAAPRPAALERLPAGAPLAVELRVPAGGELLASVGFEVPLPEELLPGGARLAPPPWTGGGEPRPARLPRRVDPRAWVYALAGGLVLALAALGSSRGAQYR